MSILKVSLLSISILFLGAATSEISFAVNADISPNPFEISEASLLVVASDSEALDDLIGEFDSVEKNYNTSEVSENSEKRGIVSGNISYFNSLHFSEPNTKLGVPDSDYWKSSKIRTDLKLKYRYSDNLYLKLTGHAFRDAIYRRNDRSGYSAEFLDEYEEEFDVDEFLVSYNPDGWFSASLGKQIVSWGTSDNLRVVDVINPLDNREPGLNDIENIRLAINMLKLDFQISDWTLSTLLISETQKDKEPVFGSQYYAFDTPLPPLVSPESENEGTTAALEYALSISGQVSGIDLDAYYAHFFENTAHLEWNAETQMPNRHLSKLTMFGFSATAAAGDWIYKSELAHFNGLEFLIAPEHNFSRMDVMIGAEYYGLTNASIAIETAFRTILDFETFLENSAENPEEVDQSFALRFNGDYLHDTLHVLLLGIAFGSEGKDGNIVRFSVGYDIQDALTITLGAISYGGGENQLYRQLSHNDQVFAKLKYSF